MFVGRNWVERYGWVYSQKKGTYESLANGIEIEKALKHLKWKSFDSSIEILKGFKGKKLNLRLFLQPISCYVLS